MWCYGKPICSIIYSRLIARQCVLIWMRVAKQSWHRNTQCGYAFRRNKSSKWSTDAEAVSPWHVTSLASRWHLAYLINFISSTAAFKPHSLCSALARLELCAGASASPLLKNPPAVGWCAQRLGYFEKRRQLDVQTFAALGLAKRSRANSRCPTRPVATRGIRGQCPSIFFVRPNFCCAQKIVSNIQ